MRLPVTPARTLRAKRMSPGSPGRTHQLGAGAGTPSTAPARGDVFLFPTPPFLSAPLPSPALPHPRPSRSVSAARRAPAPGVLASPPAAGWPRASPSRVPPGAAPPRPWEPRTRRTRDPRQGRWCRWASGVRVASCPGLTGRLCGPGQWLRPTEPRFPHAQGGAATALSPRTGEKRQRAAACEEPRGSAGLAGAPFVSDIAAPDRGGFSIVVHRASPSPGCGRKPLAWRVQGLGPGPRL